MSVTLIYVTFTGNMTPKVEQYIGTCANTGCTFFVFNRKAKYCSNACRMAAHREDNRNTLPGECNNNVLPIPVSVTNPPVIPYERNIVDNNYFHTKDIPRSPTQSNDMAKAKSSKPSSPIDKHTVKKGETQREVPAVGSKAAQLRAIREAKLKK